jgi:DNA-binding helix-hairpin-helix protein with protein kinase domain
VFEVLGKQDLVAKVYHAPASLEKARKLQAMVTLASSELLALTAWPVDVLTGHDGRVQGLLMPKVDGYKDIHALYGPKSRCAEFPSANWCHLVRAAANIARAFAVLHEKGCVVGDINHGGIRVRTDMTVKMIDCDSFQIQSNGQIYFCEVGVENFTPPELQGQSFKGMLRTANHDNFGLAVMIFYLLLLGRHPFAGRFSGAGEMPIEKAIREYRYAYGSTAKLHQMAPPPFAPAAVMASVEIAGLWERAFSRDSAQGASRPSAREWVQRLKALETNTTRCTQHPGHYFVPAAGRCPWCAIESAAGALLFLAPLGAILTDTRFNLASVWTRITQIPHPGPIPEISLPAVQPSSAAPSETREKHLRWAVA